MNYTKKLISLSVSLLILHMVSGCTSLYQALGWEDRTLPDGDTVNFENRHTPPLNPTPGSNEGIMHVPNENKSQINELPGDTTSPTSMAVPVVPVTTVAMDSTTSAPSGSSYPSLTSVPQSPTVPSKDNIKSNFNSMQTQKQASESARSNLMNDANATVMTSPQTGQLVANPAQAMPASSTAPTSSPFSAAPSAPATPVAGAPQQGSSAVASTGGNTSSDSGFNSWLHGLKNMFSSNKQPATATAMKTPAENPTEAPSTYSPAAAPAVSEASIPPAAPATAAAIPAPSTVTMSDNTAPILHDPTAKHTAAALTSPSPAIPAPVAMSAPAPAPKQPLAPIPSLEPSSASQQMPPAVSSNSLPDISQLTRQDDQPVNLVQPSGPPMDNNYIETSRYPQND